MPPPRRCMRRCSGPYQPESALGRRGAPTTHARDGDGLSHGNPLQAHPDAATPPFQRICAPTALAGRRLVVRPLWGLPAFTGTAATQHPAANLVHAQLAARKACSSYTSASADECFRPVGWPTEATHSPLADQWSPWRKPWRCISSGCRRGGIFCPLAQVQEPAQ